jgi:HK97 family phage portal protein
MGLIASLFEFRSDTSNLANPKQWLIDYFGGGGQSKTGISVTPDSAMRASAVYSCVRIISEIVGCTPCILYQNDGEESRKRARNHPIYDLLHLRPNRWQTPLEFKEMMTGHLCLRGNAYAHIQMVSVPNGIVLELVPLHPDRVFPSILNDRIVGYEYSPLQGSPASYATGEIMHLRGLSSDGLMGMSPITAHQEAIGLSLAAEEHASRIFANGAGIRGVLQTDAVLKPDAFERLKTQFSDIYSGLRNVGKTAILESGVKWQAIGMTSKDAEFLELRQF